MVCEDDNQGPGVVIAQCSKDVEAGAFSQIEIQNDHVGTALPDAGDGLGGTFGETDELDSIEALQFAADANPHLDRILDVVHASGALVAGHDGNRIPRIRYARGGLTAAESPLLCKTTPQGFDGVCPTSDQSTR